MTPSRWSPIPPRPRTASSTLRPWRKVGISPEMIRLSIGLEHIDDIIEDIDHALGPTYNDVASGR